MDRWASELVYQLQHLTQNTAPDLTLKTYMPCLLKTGGIKSKIEYLKKKKKEFHKEEFSLQLF